ncbi:hypothetical protein CMK19_20800 [Candidatus Poribacteria bacterium]|nr:hypothetical protein [Candidatus Poribacteria bacterium]MEE2911878.1 Trm112 family protein [Candidatus Poribacteria bacterium]|tara:strand:- start:930 stop:1229 length:300 start_codon:yes stop_codon:yes gene_type:complete
MPIKDELMKILCCPVSKKTVRVMTVNELEQVNSHITASSCIPIEFKSVGGKVINQKLEEGLITIDEKIIYQVRNNIPHMIPEQGIPVPIDFQFSQPEAI